METLEGGGKAIASGCSEGGRVEIVGGVGGGDVKGNEKGAVAINNAWEADENLECRNES